MARYRQQHYSSFEDFSFRETPKFDTLSDAIDGLMDSVFLDEIAYQKRHESDDDDLFEAKHFEPELDFAY